MNRQYNILPTVLFLLSVILCGSSLSAEEKIVDLFDGKTLDGWVTADGKQITKGWVVKKGLLMRKKSGGNIYTAREYDNFELTFEWKIAKRGNSGVKYRIAHYEKGVWGKPEWLGCEYQMLDDGGRPGSGKGSTGSIYNLVAPNDKKKLRPVGKFNTSRIVADGTKIEHWLNGEKIAEADTSSDEWKEAISQSKFKPVKGFFENSSGRIMLQDHGSRVWFRTIHLKTIGKKE